MSAPVIKIFDDAQAISQGAAGIFVEQAINSVALSGGSTPKSLFSLLATDAYRSKVDWDKLNIYWGDERCVPPDHEDSNYRMARLAMLDAVKAPHVFRMKGEIDPEQAAQEYEKLLPAEPIDLLLLGMGPDGHTASLFPHSPALSVTNRRVCANYVEKFSSWRVTLTVSEVQRAKHVLFLVGGADKAPVLKHVLNGDYTPDEYPSQLLRNATGTVTWFIDKAAAAEL